MEQALVELQREWQGILEHARANVGRWERRVLELEEEESRLRAAGEWLHGRDDYLGVLGRERDELTHSRMIAWLLDPCSRHGLGDRVLSGLLEEAGFPSAGVDARQARTRCEVPLLQGRLDVVVEAPGLYLVIENKVDAVEGDDQTAYYARNLCSHARCILLSPDGRAPHKTDRFVPIKFKQLADVLGQALQYENRRASGRSIVEDYLRTLQREFA